MIDYKDRESCSGSRGGAGIALGLPYPGGRSATVITFLSLTRVAWGGTKGVIPRIWRWEGRFGVLEDTGVKEEAGSAYM